MVRHGAGSKVAEAVEGGSGAPDKGPLPLAGERRDDPQKQILALRVSK